MRQSVITTVGDCKGRQRQVIFRSLETRTPTQISWLLCKLDRNSPSVVSINQSIYFVTHNRYTQFTKTKVTKTFILCVTG